MQKYIAGNWVQQTNVNLNTKIYLRNEINFNVPPQTQSDQGRILAKIQGHRNNTTTASNHSSSFEQRVCNPANGIKLGQEGGAVKGWKLQGIIAVTRHGDRGPMVHVRDANSVDCGVPEKGKGYFTREIELNKTIPSFSKSPSGQLPHLPGQQHAQHIPEPHDLAEDGLLPRIPSLPNHSQTMSIGPTDTTRNSPALAARNHPVHGLRHLLGIRSTGGVHCIHWWPTEPI